MKVVYTIKQSNVPVPHVDKGEDAVEGGHEDVRYGQVQQEVVSHAPHAAVCCKTYLSIGTLVFVR